MPLDPCLAAKVSLIEGLEFSDLADPAKASRVLEFYSEEGRWEEPTSMTIETLTIPGGDTDVVVRIGRKPESGRVLRI